MPAGRPTVMTPKILSKLEEYFICGCSDKEAIFMAGVASSTFYDYCEKHPEFMEKKELLKDMPKLQARINIKKALDKGDLAQSNWYLERKAKEEFSSRNELTGKDGVALLQIVDDVSN